MATIEVTGKNIVVTGGASGIGRGIVKALCGENNLFVVDRDTGRLAELAAECPGITTICADISDWDGVQGELERRLPEVVHGLVNNAGVGGVGDVMECGEEAFDNILGVNLRGMVAVSQMFARRVISANEKRGEGDTVLGSIVNVSSLASRFPTRVSVAYNVSKAGVDMLTKCMALELGVHNIRANSVNPGIVLGTDLSAAWIGESGQQLKEALLRRTPLGRVVTVDDVVNAVVFLLAGDNVSMVNGESLVLDGGYSVM